MRVNEQILMHQLVNKGILCSESVKAKMNGSCVASLDRFSTKNGGSLPVEASELYPGCSVNYFLTQTHLNELSQNWKRTKTWLENLVKLGIPESKSWEFANTRQSYWRVANSPILATSLTNQYFENLNLLTFSRAYSKT